MLQEAGVAITRTHDLEKLHKDALPHYAELRGLRRGLLFLTDYAVDIRYPGRDATTRQMQAALRWAGRTRQSCRRLLGLRDRRQRTP
jgi:hypothetical protein